MRRTPGEVPLPNLKVFRAAWVAALVIAAITLFTLGRPDTPKLTGEPPSFDAARAAADMRTIVEDFPGRTAGSDPDNRAAIWIEQQFKQAGLDTHIESFVTTINGEDIAVQNVWGLSRGETRGTILLMANRDVPPLATQGANDNASGVAALLELARDFSVTAHDHSLIFLCTSGDAYGAVGARQFVQEHETDDLYAAIALRRVATRDSTGIGLDGWSTADKVAPPWLWLLAPPAARAAANEDVLLPTVAGQIVRLAVPTSSGSQGPFVAAGVPALTVYAAGEDVPAQNDTLDTVSLETMAEIGATVQTMVTAVDATSSPGARSGGTIFLKRQRTLPGASLALVLAAALLPLVIVTVDLFAHCRRARVAVAPAWTRAALHLAPWLVALAVVYVANLVGLLPQSPGAVFPPGSPVAQNPRYLRVVILVVVLVVAYAYAVAIERRLERRVPTDPRAIVFVAHAALVVIAALTMLVNPYSVLLVLPAGLLWPLARPGGWVRSILPAYLGLVAIPLVLAYYAADLDLGANVWWYFFLLLENRTVPVGGVVLGLVFLSTAGMLAHALHERGMPAGALAWDAQVGAAQPAKPAAEAPGEAGPEGAGVAPRRRLASPRRRPLAGTHPPWPGVSSLPGRATR